MKRLLLILGVAAIAQAQPSYTTVTGPIYTPFSGQLFTGTLQVSGKVAIGINSSAVAGWAKTFHIGDGSSGASDPGQISFSIVPNDTAQPQRSVYIFQFTPTRNSGAVYSQVCTVPTSASPVLISAVCVTGPAPTPNVAVNLSQITQSGASSGNCPVWGGNSWAPVPCLFTRNSTDPLNYSRFGIGITGSAGVVSAHTVGTGAPLTDIQIGFDSGTKFSVNTTGITQVGGPAGWEFDPTIVTSGGALLHITPLSGGLNGGAVMAFHPIATTGGAELMLANSPDKYNSHVLNMFLIGHTSVVSLTRLGTGSTPASNLIIGEGIGNSALTNISFRFAPSGTNTYTFPGSILPTGIQLGDATQTNFPAKPTCDGTAINYFGTTYGGVRGQLWYSGPTPGVKDVVQVCAKDAADVWAWRTIY